MKYNKFSLPFIRDVKFHVPMDHLENCLYIMGVSLSIHNKSNVNDVYYSVFMLNMLWECLSDNR